MAPESTIRAFLRVLYEVTLLVRNCHEQMPGEQLFDLMDAIHNVPVMLTQHSDSFNAQKMRDLYFTHYDQKWAADGRYSLVKMLDEAMAREV